MSTMVKLSCESCKKEFARPLNKVNYNKKFNQKNYCSRKCVANDTVAKLSFKEKNVTNEIKEHANNKLDEYSPFRYHLRSIKNHKKRKKCEITLQDLKEQWDKQNGICPYTGWKLKNLPTTGDRMSITPDRASVDRIDSSKPYTKDNIEFVALMYNYCKNNFMGKDVQEFAQSIMNTSYQP